ncbi:eukaryotic translation initiation factor 4E class II [Clavulina sp. PMI_390]|nr:eukaryotic translation initiation factor 4E class II [Clavulina sp. PMI_390]
MSGHSYFSNQSQRFSSSATNQSPAHTTSSNGNGGSIGTNGPSASETIARPTRQMSRSRLSLSVATEKDGNGRISPASELPRSVHPLRSTWVFWYRQQRGGKVVNYEEGIKQIGFFSSVENFWALWTHLSPPSTLQATTDYIVFHDDVKRPVWEDPYNRDGGKWIIRLKKGIADRLWEDLVLAVVGDQFDDQDRVCGCVLSVRSQEDIMSVWHQDESDSAAKERIKETIKRCLSLGSKTVMEYKTNNDSLHDKSSFRTIGAEKVEQPI